jgi:hypothetical protein
LILSRVCGIAALSAFLTAAGSMRAERSTV